MCILRYFPAIVPSFSKTTAVLWYRPGARFSKGKAPRRYPILSPRHRRFPSMGRGSSLPSQTCSYLPSGRNTGRYAVLARRPPLPPGQLYGYLPLASLYSPLYQRYSFVVLILLSYLIGCSCYSIKPSGYCIVTQCREPCCLISGRQLIPTISRSGNASRKAALAISSFGES